MKGDTILRAYELSYFVGPKALVADVDLELKEGEFHAIIGRNGAGKSTLLKLVTGELRADKGSIALWGQPIDEFKVLQLAQRRAVLAQHTELNFNYRVIEVALLGRLPHQRNQVETAEDVAIAAECLRQVDLGGYEERNYLTLSGGEQQRTHLARVLAQLGAARESRLMFLDEPTTGLDLHHQHQALDLVRRLANEGVSVVATLHDLNLAARFADRITLLAEGRVMISGTPQEVLQESVLFAAFRQPLLVTRHPCFDCPLVIVR